MAEIWELIPSYDPDDVVLVNRQLLQAFLLKYRERDEADTWCEWVSVGYQELLKACGLWPEGF